MQWQHLIDAPFDISEKCCAVLKKRPAAKFEKENKLMPIIGTWVNESTLRLQKYLSTGCNAFAMKRPASYPISIWDDKDKWTFIKKNNVPYCEIYDKGATQTGCMVCGFGCHHDERFRDLAISHPKAFEIGMNYKNNGVTYAKAINTALKTNVL